MPRVGINVSITSISSRLKLPRIGGLRAQLDKQTKTYVEELVEFLQDYPPASRDQDYVRTDDLKYAWRIKNTSSGSRISYTFSNYVRDPKGRYYARYVHGGPLSPNEQASIHMVRWPTIDDAFDAIATRHEFRASVQHTIERAMETR